MVTLTTTGSCGALEDLGTEGVGVALVEHRLWGERCLLDGFVGDAVVGVEQIRVLVASAGHSVGLGFVAEDVLVGARVEHWVLHRLLVERL